MKQEVSRKYETRNAVNMKNARLEATTSLNTMAGEVATGELETTKEPVDSASSVASIESSEDFYDDDPYVPESDGDQGYERIGSNGLFMTPANSETYEKSEQENDGNSSPSFSERNEKMIEQSETIRGTTHYNAENSPDGSVSDKDPSHYYRSFGERRFEDSAPTPVAENPRPYSNGDSPWGYDVDSTRHDDWQKQPFHAAECDGCHGKGLDQTGALQICIRCNQQWCKKCIVEVCLDGIHFADLDALDWGFVAKSKKFQGNIATALTYGNKGKRNKEDSDEEFIPAKRLDFKKVATRRDGRLPNGVGPSKNESKKLTTFGNSTFAADLEAAKRKMMGSIKDSQEIDSATIFNDIDVSQGNKRSWSSITPEITLESINKSRKSIDVSKEDNSDGSAPDKVSPEDILFMHNKSAKKSGKEKKTKTTVARQDDDKFAVSFQHSFRKEASGVRAVSRPSELNDFEEGSMSNYPRSLYGQTERGEPVRKSGTASKYGDYGYKHEIDDDLSYSSPVKRRREHFTLGGNDRVFGGFGGHSRTRNFYDFQPSASRSEISTYDRQRMSGSDVFRADRSVRPTIEVEHLTEQEEEEINMNEMLAIAVKQRRDRLRDEQARENAMKASKQNKANKINAELKQMWESHPLIQELRAQNKNDEAIELLDNAKNLAFMKAGLREE
jgi:hypothetical protein